tara:strand:+ start:475 stop:654 length:180 start_codon:yes stop_codon:yes gene_type:complete
VVAVEEEVLLLVLTVLAEAQVQEAEVELHWEMALQTLAVEEEDVMVQINQLDLQVARAL